MFPVGPLAISGCSGPDMTRSGANLGKPHGRSSADSTPIWLATGADPGRRANQGPIRIGPDLEPIRVNGDDLGPIQERYGQIRTPSSSSNSSSSHHLAPPSSLLLFLLLPIILCPISPTVAAPFIFKTAFEKQPHRHQPPPPPAPRHLLLRGCCVCNTCFHFGIADSLKYKFS